MKICDVKNVKYGLTDIIELIIIKMKQLHWFNIK